MAEDARDGSDDATERRASPKAAEEPLPEAEETFAGTELRPADPPSGPSSDVNLRPPPRFRTPSPHASRFRPGDVLSERFSIVRFIARGGMGDVYEAVDLEFGERVALKTVRLEAAADSKAMERFLREIHLARQVTHPNVCRIFDVFHHRLDDSGFSSLLDPDVPPPPTELTFLTMEFLPGRTLAETLRESGPMPVEQAFPIVQQIAEALHAAHSKGIVHRDLKSANVLLVPGDGGAMRAIVTDFGIARGLMLDDGVTGTMTVMGTPAYMAPEQVTGGKLTPRTDLYALGVVMYELVTGHRPFTGDASYSTAHRRLSEDAPSPSLKKPGLDPVWDRVILRCLERDPADRYASAVHVIGALEGLDVSPGRRVKKRQLAVGVGIALGVLGLSLVGIAAVRMAGPKRPPPKRSAHALAPVQVTTSAGLDLYPTFSPDGRSVSFSSDRTGAFEIYVQPLLAGGRVMQLTNDEMQNFEPAWSPDGQVIAFHSKKRGGIWLVPALGGSPRQLTEFGSRPAFSPNGETVAFQSDPLVDLSANASEALTTSTIWTVPTRGGTPKQLTKPPKPSGGHGSPSWSPDGSRIAFMAFDHVSSSLWTISPTGDGLTPIESKELRRYDPVYTSDGTSLYYCSISSTWNYGLWRQPLGRSGKPEGEAYQVMDLGAVTMKQIALSHDGTKLLYAALSMPSNLWSVSPDGDGKPRRITSETGRISRPWFSPDGKRLAFVKWHPGSGQDIWVMDAEGQGLRQVTSSPADDFMPSWFPDGERLVFRSSRASRTGMWTVRLDSRAESFLFATTQMLDEPRLSPDGKLLAFHARSKSDVLNAWTVPVVGGTPRQVTDEKEMAGFPTWSPDGQVLALELKDGEHTQVGIVSASGGKPRRLTSEPGQSWAYSFSPDGDRIAFAGQREGIWNIWWVSRSTGEQHAVTTNRKLNATLRYPTWSPRGDQIVYEYAETTGNIWMLDGLE